MDANKIKFLEAVVGHDGARALLKTIEKRQDLANIIFPRTVLAWLDVIETDVFKGNVPGTDNIQLEFSKSDGFYNGHMTLNSVNYEFKQVDFFHVAGTVAVALGHDTHFVAPKSSMLANLTKSIDLLVKANKRAPYRKKPIQLPGTAAKPIEPAQPVPQDNIEPNKLETEGVGTPAGTKVKLPKIAKTKKSVIKISKSQSLINCSLCGRPQFKSDKYVGCACMSEFSKSVKTTPTNGGYILELSNLDADISATIAESFKDNG